MAAPVSVVGPVVAPGIGRGLQQQVGHVLYDVEHNGSTTAGTLLKDNRVNSAISHLAADIAHHAVTTVSCSLMQLCCVRCSHRLVLPQNACWKALHGSALVDVQQTVHGNA